LSRHRPMSGKDLPPFELSSLRPCPLAASYVLILHPTAVYIDRPSWPGHRHALASPTRPVYRFANYSSGKIRGRPRRQPLGMTERVTGGEHPMAERVQRRASCGVNRLWRWHYQQSVRPDRAEYPRHYCIHVGGGYRLRTCIACIHVVGPE
jgi:hypothetical protein